MSGIQDSEAHFAARAAEYGVPPVARLKAQGISTLGHLAFAVFRPGADFIEREFDQWATDVNLGTPKAVPFAEKAARLQQLRERFQGLNIQGAGEPSSSQFETRVLKHIEAQRCTSREVEIQSGLSGKKLKLDAGTLAIKETREVPDEAISTTFHLAMCLRRRGLAYEFANLISFRVHELYTERLLKHLSTEPPVGFQATTLAQVMRADREVFSFLVQEVPNIRPDALNVRPLDDALDRALRDYNVAFHLVPLPKHAVREEATYAPKRPTNDGATQFSSPYKGKGKGKNKGFSAALKRLGFDVIAVDKTVSKSPKVMVTKLDLTQYSNQLLVLDWIRSPQARAVFVAPPCGTASQARNIQDDSIPNLPQPLRSYEQPDGLDDLADLDFLRVGQANILYDFVATCYDVCCQLDQLFMCENPKDSLFWFITPWQERQYTEQEVEQIHQACAYGSLRPKWTKLAGNFEETTMVNKTCPGDHVHAPWGFQQQGSKRIYATSLEVNYPPALCDAIAVAIATALRRRNIVPAAAGLSNQAAKAFSDVQPASNKAEFLKRWMLRAHARRHDEKALKASMEPDIAEAVSNKRILVFEEMLRDTGFPDIGVVDELKKGSDLTGTDGKCFACIRVFDPGAGRMKYFRSKVLPFGAVRSVHAFLRLARALWWLGVVGCKVVWTSFYDDFISCSRPPLVKCTESTIVSLFKLLGWMFAEEGDKCMPFGDVCEALGVVFDLKDSFRGFAAICNTEARVRELCADLQVVIEAGTLTCKEAQRLRGRMQFADAQLFGRTGKRCLRVLGDFAENRRRRLLPKDMLFLKLFMQLLRSNSPREVRALGRNNTVIFTDACYERDSEAWPCGIGGVLCDVDVVQFFSLEVGSEERKALGELYKKQIIFEAKTLSAVVAFVLWKDLFANKRCLLFVDNEGTKFSLLKGMSENGIVDQLAELFAEYEILIHSFVWLARVPSKSNIADPPSRGDVSHSFFVNASNVSHKAKTILDGLISKLNENGESCSETIHVTRHYET
eukprot:s3258_g6.t1